MRNYKNDEVTTNYKRGMNIFLILLKKGVEGSNLKSSIINPNLVSYHWKGNNQKVMTLGKGFYDISVRNGGRSIR